MYMTQNTAIGIVVGLVVVLGGGYYLMGLGATPGAQTQALMATSTPQAETAEAGKFTGSIAELATRGGSWKCTVDSTTTHVVSSGVAYVSDGKVRGDFTTSVSGYGNLESHMFADGTDVYTWSSVAPQGMKMKMTALSTDNVHLGYGAQANESFSYDCQPWVADVSLLTPPASVTFKAVGQ